MTFSLEKIFLLTTKLSEHGQCIRASGLTGVAIITQRSNSF